MNGKQLRTGTAMAVVALGLVCYTVAFAQDSSNTFERDRQAILAMAGEYDVSFHFEETLPLADGYVPHDPENSRGRELILVIDDRGGFISLQHLLVVDTEEKDSVSDPADAWRQGVIKHWRQDWRYEDTVVWEFAGNDTWNRRSIPRAEAQGTWTQAVFQVDDAPRYESFGHWAHFANRSVWESGETWRPLPRRERTRKGEYDVLVGRNRHTIMPSGWAHEQDNYKLKLARDGGGDTVLVRESGLNTYTRLAGSPLTAAREYWRRTALFWGDVRHQWEQALGSHTILGLAGLLSAHERIDSLFQMAEDYGQDLTCDPAAMHARIGGLFEKALPSTRVALSGE